MATAFFATMLLDFAPVMALAGTYKNTGAQSYCGSLTAGVSAGGACDTVANSGNYRGAGLGANKCRVLNCLY
ncbi:MAG: hypothetical protein Q7U04_14080 [Bacteriovorax sp.]|nr:hypothetical protein [Bacteriovorax sp.]